VFALYTGLLFGAASVGMAAAGGLLGPLNPRVLLLAAGGGGIVAGAVGCVWYARLRRKPRTGDEPGVSPDAAR
jgi:hypothetical protein